MTYASANRRPNPAALVGALGIPGAFGALLVVGLAVKVATKPADPRIKGEIITEAPLPPPPPPDPQPTSATTTTTTTTVIPLPLPMDPPLIELPIGDTFPTFPGPGDTAGTGTGDLGIPGPTPSASPYDPIIARPKGKPSNWVTNDDYRPRWIIEEMAGTAGFSLSIDARGRVTGCTITRSTGHAPLDAATCDLVSKRARFDAARDGTGKAVAGSYRGSVTWRIPE
jgi:protein TonB